MNKCIELLPCDWLISNLCYQAIEQVYLIKWPVSVYIYMYIYICDCVGDVGIMNTVSRVGGHSRLYCPGQTHWNKQHHRLFKLQLDDDA